MALDGDAMADADEANEEGPDAPEAEGDAPETFPEQRDAGADEDGGTEQADLDADMADQADARDGAHPHPSKRLLSCCSLIVFLALSSCIPAALQGLSSEGYPLTHAVLLSRDVSSRDSETCSGGFRCA